jgi:hypothetical protein
MPNYQNGKIYAIKSYQTELIYIGSTIRPLSQRLGKHRDNYKKNGKTSSKEILKYPDYYIELIELFPCNSKEELIKREGYFIKQNINICVNCYIPGRTIKEYYIDNKEQFKEQHKQYYIDNKVHINEQKKQYRLNNKEQINEKSKEYYINNAEKKKQYSLDNKEHIKEYQKQYRLENAEKNKEYQKQYYQKCKELKQLKQTNNQEPTKNQEEN